MVQPQRGETSEERLSLAGLTEAWKAMVVAFPSTATSHFHAISQSEVQFLSQSSSSFNLIYAFYLRTRSSSSTAIFSDKGDPNPSRAEPLIPGCRSLGLDHHRLTTTVLSNLQRHSAPLISQNKTCNKSPVSSAWHPFTWKSGTPGPRISRDTYEVHKVLPPRHPHSNPSSFIQSRAADMRRSPQLRCATRSLKHPLHLVQQLPL
jgi:hypothetical protein